MKTLRIKGFRSIRDSGEIQLKPITAVIGRNSCGKSSFLRFFPLLKQSSEKEISETLLWYGDYVDFGNYNSIKPQFSNDISTSFELKLNLNNFNVPYYYIRTFFNEQINMDVTVKAYILEKYVSKLLVSYLDQEIEIFMSGDGVVDKVIINGYEQLIDSSQYKWTRSSTLILPIIEKKGDKRNYFYFREDKDVENEIYKILETIAPKNTKNRRIEELTKSLLTMPSKRELKKYLCNYDTLMSISNYFNEEKSEELFNRLNAYVAFYNFTSLLFAFNRVLLTEIENIHYLKPIRANVNRYYRIQGLNIDHVDADGSNLAMILYNLTDDERAKFEKWSSLNFGIKFSVSKDSGHASLIIYDNKGNKINLADTGYGYSQILPIIVELWLLLNQKKNLDTKNIMVVIEQPELHLHPAFQAKVIDLFANIINQAKKQQIELKIIFETHSETMINRLGYLVSKNILNINDVNILAFEKDAFETEVSSMSFNEMGIISEWPIGFFSMED